MFLTGFLCGSAFVCCVGWYVEHRRGKRLEKEFNMLEERARKQTEALK